MPKSAMIRARMEPGLKDRAEAMLEQLGLSATTAITLFYRQVIQQRGLPFDLRIPNAPTQRAMQDARTGRGVIKAESMDDLLARLDAGPAKKPARVAKRRTRSAR
jgi:DNA-damage-inducible protein J